jgi:hypothetical protein
MKVQRTFVRVLKILKGFSCQAWGGSTRFEKKTGGGGYATDPPCQQSPGTRFTVGSSRENLLRKMQQKGGTPY